MCHTRTLQSGRPGGGLRQGSIQGPALDQPEDLGGSNGKLDERIPAVFGEPSYNVLPR